MKLYTNYDKIDYKRLIITGLVFYFVLSVSAFYFIDGVLNPFAIATNEFINYPEVRDGIFSYIEAYKNGELESNLDRNSMLMFIVLQYTGGVLTSSLFFFLYLIMITKVIKIILSKFNLYYVKPFKISRKPIE